MPTFKITAPDGNSYDVNAPEGASEADVLAYAQRTYKMAAAPKAPSKPFGQQLNEGIADIPRQVGLTARAALSGIGGGLDFLASPFRGAMNMLPGVDIKPGGGDYLANSAGLPQPQGQRERIAQDVAKSGFSALTGFGGAKAVAQTAGSPAVRELAQTLMMSPAQQAVGAAAAGGAGGYTRETGGNEVAQLAASLGAGIGAPMAMNKVASTAQRVGQSIGSRFPSTPAQQAAQQIQVDVTINNALKDSGLALESMAPEVAAGIRADVSKAMVNGTENLSPDAVRRLADYRLTGLTPTAAKLTLDPAMVTQQENLAKLGINSKDVAAQELGRVKSANDRGLTQGLNKLGAGGTDDQIAGADKIMGTLESRNARAQGLINDRYNAAKSTEGRSAALDHETFVSRANELLDNAMLGGKLPSDVRNLLNKDWTGVVKGGAEVVGPKAAPLTVSSAEQIKTNIAALQRASSDAAERKALGMVRSALEETPLLPGQDIGEDAMKAFTEARTLNRKWMGIVEKTPALQAIREGVEPDKFVQDFIVGTGKNANTMDVAALKSSIKSNPEAMSAVREQIADFLKSKALSGNADEVGNFSASAYNKALNAIGDRKLALFFPKTDIDQLKAIGRVSGYENFQPRGSAVNNSNTAATGMASMIDRFGSSALLSKVPGGKLLSDPLQNIAIGINAKRSLDVPGALAFGVPPSGGMPQLNAGNNFNIPPMLLLQLQQEQERQRQQGQ